MVFFVRYDGVVEGIEVINIYVYCEVKVIVYRFMSSFSLFIVFSLWFVE